ncbi:hypothetical protein BDAP_000457 [Binucleata daphniae]
MNEKTQTLLSPVHAHHKTFGGLPGESLENWLRQFKYFLDCAHKYDTENLHSYASTLLIDDAGKFYDNLPTQPLNWNEFVKILMQKYNTQNVNIPELHYKITNTKQGNSEPTLRYIEEMHKTALLTGLQERLYVEIIIANLIQHIRIQIRLHINHDYTIKNLIRLVTLLELENNNNNHDTYKTQEDNRTQHNTYRDTNTNQRIEQLMHEIQLLKTGNNTTRHDTYNRYERQEIKCNIVVDLAIMKQNAMLKRITISEITKTHN